MVAPAGAVITPGSHNILRNVVFTVTAISVDESAGHGDAHCHPLRRHSQAIDVNYTTVNGTAVRATDLHCFEQISGMVHFAVGDAPRTS